MRIAPGRQCASCRAAHGSDLRKRWAVAVSGQIWGKARIAAERAEPDLEKKGKGGVIVIVVEQRAKVGAKFDVAAGDLPPVLVPGLSS
jgi:hypothetical protein